MSLSSVVLRRRTEAEPAYEGYVDLDESIEPQRNVSGAQNRIQGIVGSSRTLRRVSGPFIKLNWAAMPVELLESELFGQEIGAFIGAVMQTLGRFEAANGGTLFMDEIGDIPLGLEAKLFRVVVEHEFEHLGSTHTRRASNSR